MDVHKDRFYVLTDHEAPRWRVVRVDPRHPKIEAWKTVVPERKDASIDLESGASVVGGRLASHVLASGSHSRYAPLIALGGGLLLVVLFQALGLRLGLSLRSEILRIPPLRSLDTAGGLLLGAATGLFLAWVLGVVALQLPGQAYLRREVQR